MRVRVVRKKEASWAQVYLFHFLSLSVALRSERRLDVCGGAQQRRRHEWTSSQSERPSELAERGRECRLSFLTGHTTRQFRFAAHLRRMAFFVPVKIFASFLYFVFIKYISFYHLLNEYVYAMHYFLMKC